MNALKSRCMNYLSGAALIALAIAGTPALAQVPRADCNALITSVPYTISAPGIYCLANNVTVPSTSATVGITINTSNAILDLNGYQIRGQHFGGVVAPGSRTTGIGTGTNAKTNITIRNGRITGVDFGMIVNTGTSGGHLIENVQLDDISGIGIALNAYNSVVRNNILDRVDGSLQTPAPGLLWAVIIFGGGNQITNNTITGLKEGADTMAFGIYSYSITPDIVSTSLIEGNFIQGLKSSLKTYGLYVILQENAMILNNRLSQLNTGISMDVYSASSVCSGNIAVGVTGSKYTNCPALPAGAPINF